MLSLFNFIIYFLLYVLIALPPGLSFLFFLSWAPKDSASYLPMSLVVGSALITALLFITGHFFPICLIHALILTLTTTLLFFNYFKKGLGELRRSLKNFREYLGLAAGLFILFLYVAAHYYQPGNQPWYYTLMSDYLKHDGVLFALKNQTLPPANPFFHPDGDISLSYYYLFHLLPASLPTMGGDTYQHLFASAAIWTGLMFICSMYVWLKEKNWDTRKINYVILGLVLLSGFDVYASYRIAKNVFADQWINSSSDLEYMFAGLLGNLANAPQHIFSFAIALGTFSLVKKSKALSLYFLWIPVLCVFGSSIYLGLAFSFLSFVYAALSWSEFKKILHIKKIWVSFSFTLFILFIFALEIAPSVGAVNTGISFRPLTLLPKMSFSWLESGTVLMRVFFSIVPFLLPMALYGFRKSFSCFTRFEITMIVSFFLMGLLLSSNGPNNDFTLRVLFVVRVFLFTLVVSLLLSKESSLIKTFIVFLIVFVGLTSTLNNFIYRGVYRLMAQSNENERPKLYLEALEKIKSDCDPNQMIQGNIVDYSKLLMLTHRKIFYLDDGMSSLLNVNPFKHQHVRSTLLSALKHPKSPESFIVFKTYRIGCLLLKKGTYSAEGNSPAYLIFENEKYTIWQLPYKLNAFRRKPSKLLAVRK